ncbi:MAG: RND transporter, partial [Pseudomonadota bacterium]
MSHSMRAIVAVCVLALSACANQQDIQPQQQRLDARQWGLDEQTLTSEGAVQSAAWWTAFDDVQLNALIERALSAQPSIQVVEARLARARAQAVAANGAEFPQIQATAKVERQRFTEHGLYPPP